MAAATAASGVVLAACGESSNGSTAGQATPAAISAATPETTVGVTLESTSEATLEPTPEAVPESSDSNLASVPAGDQRPAPDFTWQQYGPTESLGRMSMTLSDIVTLGKPVVLNFWAGLCPPCRREMPEYQEAWEVIKDRITLVGVDVGSFTNLGSNDDALKLIAELGVTYPLGTTFDAQIVREYRILGMPASVFITTQGTIVRTWNGVLDTNGLIELVEELEAASEAGV